MQATDFLRQGIAVIPVLPKSKTPAVRWQRYQAELPSRAQLERWQRPIYGYNFAVVCGWQGLTVLDFDGPGTHTEWRAWALTAGQVARGVAATTYRVRTARGLHVYLFCNEAPRCGALLSPTEPGKPAKRWGDVKGRGGMVLIPPSVHPSGAVYTAIDDSAPILRVRSLADVLPEPPPMPAPAPLPTVNVYPASSLWPLSRIEEIKARLPILGYFPDAKPSGGGRWYAARCPFHDDDNPSLWIDVEKGRCGCYSGCTSGRPLDSIGVYARLYGLDNKAAIRELARVVGL